MQMCRAVMWNARYKSNLWDVTDGQRQCNKPVTAQFHLPCRWPRLFSTSLSSFKFDCLQATDHDSDIASKILTFSNTLTDGNQYVRQLRKY